MRWASESWETRKRRLTDWHPWFAWRPVQAGEHKAWLEWVERRLSFKPDQPWWTPSMSQVVLSLWDREYRLTPARGDPERL